MDNTQAKKNEPMIKEVHVVRQDIQTLINKVSGSYNSRESSLVVTKLQEAKMWAGQMLSALGSKLPPEYQDNARE